MDSRHPTDSYNGCIIETGLSSMLFERSPYFPHLKQNSLVIKVPDIWSLIVSLDSNWTANQCLPRPMHHIYVTYLFGHTLPPVK